MRSMTLLAAAATALVLAGCSATHETCPKGSITMLDTQSSSGSAKFVHCVFFNMKPGTPEAEIDSLIADAHMLLAKVPSVRKIDSGRRDARMTRDVNVTDYAVGLVVYFDDKAGHDLYSEHPLHMEYVNKHQEHWASVRVFDFTAQ